MEYSPPAQPGRHREAEALLVFLLLTLSPRPGSHTHAIRQTHHSLHSLLGILALCLLKTVESNLG